MEKQDIDPKQKNVAVLQFYFGLRTYNVQACYCILDNLEDIDSW